MLIAQLAPQLQCIILPQTQLLLQIRDERVELTRRWAAAGAFGELVCHHIQLDRFATPMHLLGDGADAQALGV